MTCKNCYGKGYASPLKTEKRLCGCVMHPLSWFTERIGKVIFRNPKPKPIEEISKYNRDYAFQVRNEMSVSVGCIDRYIEGLQKDKVTAKRYIKELEDYIKSDCRLPAPNHPDFRTDYWYE